MTDAPNRFRRRLGLKASLGFLLLASLVSCASSSTVLDLEKRDSFLPLGSRFTNLSEPACRESFSGQVASVLVKQGETADVANQMTDNVMSDLRHNRAPVPFYVFSPADTRYGFIVQNTDFGCVLRLYQRQRRLSQDRWTVVTDTIKYLDSRTVLYCACGENVDFSGPASEAI